MGTLSEDIAKAFGGTPKPVVYAGGVMGIQVSLHPEAYDRAKAFLTDRLGAPAEVDRWHPSQVGKPLRFGALPRHVNLIMVGRLLRTRRALITYFPEEAAS